MTTKKKAKMLKKEQKLLERAEREENYKVAATWRVLLLPMNSSASVMFMMLMMYVSYYAAGPVGLGTVVASLIITGSRILDAITDPIVGFVLDRLMVSLVKLGRFCYWLYTISLIYHRYVLYFSPCS